MLARDSQRGHREEKRHKNHRTKLAEDAENHHLGKQDGNNGVAGASQDSESSAPVVPKIGPPRGQKRKRPTIDTQDRDKPASSAPVLKIGPPRSRKRRRLIVNSDCDMLASSAPGPSAHGEPVATVEDAVIQDVRSTADDIEPNYWQFDFDVPGHDAGRPLQDLSSRDALVPETQSYDDSTSPRAVTQERSDDVERRPLDGNSSVTSRMKHRSNGSTIRKGKPPLVGTALPSLPVPSSRPPSGDLPSAEQDSDSDAVPQRPLKTLRPVPTLSPSVFRPHLPAHDLEPPPSSIEQFSSPEKGGKGTMRHIFRKGVRYPKERRAARVPEPAGDDESLRLLGHQLAEEATATNRRSRPSDDDYERLFRESATPEPADSSEEAIVESTLSQVREPENEVYDDAGDAQRRVSSIQDGEIPSSNLAEAIEDAYIDFDAGQAAPVASHKPAVEAALDAGSPGEVNDPMVSWIASLTLFPAQIFHHMLSRASPKKTQPNEGR